MKEMKYVGQSCTRLDGKVKIAGAAQFVDDIPFGSNLLFAEIVESPLPHAIIKRIDTSRAGKIPGVVRIVIGKDFPCRFGLYMQDRYIFAQDRVRFAGEQVAAVIARDPRTAKRAAALVRVDYEELPPVISVQDALKTNPDLVKGQVAGGLLQGIATVLYEDMRFGRKGKILNANFADYKIPTSMDIPEEVVPILVEVAQSDGPFGARGMGEHTMIPVAPIIANAIEDAVGIRMKSMPITAEKLALALLDKNNH